MKKALMSMFCVIIIIIFILMFFTMHGRNLRQTELNNALTSSMEQAMDMLLLEDDKPQSEDEWKVMYQHRERLSWKNILQNNCTEIVKKV